MAINKRMTAMPEDKSDQTPTMFDYSAVFLKLQPDSQNHKILKYLIHYGSITQAQAAKYFSCYRLGARIAELRSMGAPIKTEMLPTQGKHKSRYAKYTLEGAEI